MKSSDNVLNILYEDNHLLVLNKPAGILTQPSGTAQDSLETQAKAWLKETYHKPGNVFLEAVHRLDKPVSGVVVFCKTSKALSRLNESIRDKRTQKIYYALVEGAPSEDEGVLEHRIVHDDFHARIDPAGKVARLSYSIVSRFERRALLSIELETGRYHQIRLQLAESGCPIVGDHKYGSKVYFEEGCIALHHFRLRIPHPVTKEMMTFEAPLPKAWEIDDETH